MASSADANDLAREASRLELGTHRESLAKETTSAISASSGYASSFRDITADFGKASTALNTGQLVKDDFFTLFESVGALEIMDPKMDSGCLEPGETLEDDYDVLRELMPEEVIAIMDQILCYEMAWHQGYPLSQTVLSSVYIDKLLWPEPRSLQDANFDRRLQGTATENKLVHIVLRAYCVAVVKCCDYVLYKITSEHYYEEEDFTTHTYNRSLLNDFETNAIFKTLEDALGWLELETSVETSLKEKIVARLNLRIETLRAFSCNYSDHHIFTRIQGLIETVRSTADAAKPVKAAFSEKIQRRLASTAPPKPVIAIDSEEAFTKLRQICDDLREAYQIAEIDYLSSPATLRNFLWAFASRKPQPLPFPRACLQSLILIEDGVDSKELIRRLMMSDLEELVLPEDFILDRTNWEVEVPSDPRHQIAKQLDGFLSRATQDYLDLLRSLCQNRCRIRRTLCHVMQAFEYLQLDAENIDVDLQALTSENPVVNPDLGNQPLYHYPLSSWTYYQKLRQMEWIAQLGFEQDIYLPDELAGMYSFLGSVISDRINHLGRISTFLKRNQKRAIRSKLQNSISNVNKTLDYNSALVEEAAGMYYLCIALGTLYSVLDALLLIPVPPRPFSSPKLRYEVRMKPFLGLSIPRIIPYEEFETRSRANLKTPKDLDGKLQIVDNAVREAKKQFGSLQKRSAEELRTRGVEDSWNKGWISPCMMACIATGLAVARLQKVQREHSHDKNLDLTGAAKVHIPGAEGRYHPWWVVPKVIEVKQDP